MYICRSTTLLECFYKEFDQCDSVHEISNAYFFCSNSSSKQHARLIRIPLDVIRPLAHIRIYREIRIRQITVTMTSATLANMATIRGVCGGIREILHRLQRIHRKAEAASDRSQSF